MGAGASLQAIGTAAVSQDSLVLTASGAPTGAHGFFFAGYVARANGVVLGNGVRCIAGPLVRIAKVAHTSGQDSIPPPNTLPLSQQLNAAAGDVMFFQYLYRDLGGPCGTGGNTTNGVLVIWGA